MPFLTRRLNAMPTVRVRRIAISNEHSSSSHHRPRTGRKIFQYQNLTWATPALHANTSLFPSKKSSRKTKSPPKRGCKMKIPDPAVQFLGKGKKARGKQSQALHRLPEAFPAPAPPWLILALAAAAAIFPLGFRCPPDMSPPPPVRTAPLAPRLLPAAVDAAALPIEGARL